MLSGAPSGAGTYTAEAMFAGSSDYAATTSDVTFTIAQAAPTLSVSDAGGTFDGFDGLRGDGDCGRRCVGR